MDNLFLHQKNHSVLLPFFFLNSLRSFFCGLVDGLLRNHSCLFLSSFSASSSSWTDASFSSACFFFSILVCLFFSFSLTSDPPKGHQIRLWRGCRPTLSLFFSVCCLRDDSVGRRIDGSSWGRLCPSRCAGGHVAWRNQALRSPPCCASLRDRPLLCDAVQHDLGESPLWVDQRRRSKISISFCFGRCYPGTQYGRYVLLVDLDAVEVRTWVSFSWAMCSADLLWCWVT